MATTVSTSVIAGLKGYGTPARLVQRAPGAGFLGVAFVPPSALLRRGAGAISGTTKSDVGAPLRRRVLVIDRASGEVVRDGWSDPVDGSFSFGLDESRSYLVIGLDDSPPAFNAPRFDGVTPG